MPAVCGPQGVMNTEGGFTTLLPGSDYRIQLTMPLDLGNPGHVTAALF